MPINLTPAVLAALFTVLGAACSDSDAEIGPELYGVYRIDAFTENAAACDAEGGSVLADDRDHAAVYGSKDFFGSALNVHVCADVARCRDGVRAAMEGRGRIAVLDIAFRQRKGDHYEGILITTGFSGGSICRDAEVTNATVRGMADAGLRLETRTVVADHPPDGRGFCTTDDTKRAAAGKPCGRLQVITATRIEPL
jgi:hypothetical protein